MPGPPYVASPSLIAYRRSAPRRGEANDELYVDELGHSMQELERWRSDGLI